MNELDAWGWDDRWAAAFGGAVNAALTPARVTAQHRGLWQVVTRQGDARLRSYRRLGREFANGSGSIRRREAERRFGKMVKKASADTYARKNYLG